MSICAGSYVHFKKPLLVYGVYPDGVILHTDENGGMISARLSALTLADKNNSNFKVGDTIFTELGRVGRITGVELCTRYAVQWHNGDEGKCDSTGCTLASDDQKEAFDSQVLRVIDDIDADIVKLARTLAEEKERLEKLHKEKAKMLEKAILLGIKV